MTPTTLSPALTAKTIWVLAGASETILCGYCVSVTVLFVSSCRTIGKGEGVWVGVAEVVGFGEAVEVGEGLGVGLFC